MINAQSAHKTIYYYCYYDAGSDDYDTGPYFLTIPAGTTSIAFNTTIISDDNVLEEDEIFYLTIDSSSLPNDITTGSPLQVTVTIMDDDCKQFYLYSCNDK